MNNTTHATLRSNLVWVLRGVVLAGGLSLAACAPMSLPGESGAQPASDSAALEAVSVVDATSTDTTPEASLTPEATNTAGLPNPTSTPLPFDTATAVAGQSVEFIGTIESFDNGVLVVSGRSVVITAQTEIKFQPQKGLNVKVEGTLQADGSILAREIKSVPDGLATHKPDDVTRTARPEGTPEPRGTQQANEIEFRGTVSAINGNVYVVDGITVVVNGEIKDTIVVGDVVKVHGVKQLDGTVIAREIELAKSDDGHDGDDDHGTHTPAPTTVGNDDHGDDGGGHGGGEGGGHGSDDNGNDDHGDSGGGHGGDDQGGGHGADDGGGDDHGGDD